MKWVTTYDYVTKIILGGKSDIFQTTYRQNVVASHEWVMGNYPLNKLLIFFCNSFYIYIYTNTIIKNK